MDPIIHADSPAERAVAEQVAAHYRQVTAITVLSTTVSVTSTSPQAGDVTSSPRRRTDDLKQDLIDLIEELHVTPHE